jgi:virulence factor Mce-like protein
VRRLLGIVLALAAAVAGVALVTGAGREGGNPRYWIEFDNAFGLVEGGDVKIAGVRAGRIASLKLDRERYRALAEIEVTQRGFGSLRRDAFCEARPQSLIGEYFVDCRPGTSPRHLPPGGRIPVEQTGSTVPADLVNSIMRRPYRERFTVLLNELGAGLAGRGEDLNATIRRAVPALRETDRVLAQLASVRHSIRRLYVDADRVVTALADNRDDVTRFVAEARDTAAITASRRAELRRQFQRLPVFLHELRPVARLLGEVAEEQIPVLRNLNANAGRLRVFLDALAPFAEASRPAFRTLAAAAHEGRPAVRAGRPRVAELRQIAEPAPEVGTNLALVLEDLDDRGRAVEKDARAPNGQGFSGLEAILRYVWAQSQAINIYDANSYMLKVSPFLDKLCADYTDAEQAKDPKRERCIAALGPSRPGIDSPDPTKRAVAGARGGRGDGPTWPSALTPGNGAPTGVPGGAPTTADPLPEALRELLDGLLPGAPAVRPGARHDRKAVAGLLDFLLAP